MKTKHFFFILYEWLGSKNLFQNKKFSYQYINHTDSKEQKISKSFHLKSSRTQKTQHSRLAAQKNLFQKNDEVNKLSAKRSDLNHLRTFVFIYFFRFAEKNAVLPFCLRLSKAYVVS